MAKRIKQPTQQQAMDFMYQVKVQGHLDLGNEWAGWKLRGPYLVSPHGDRILPQRLTGLLYGETLRKRVYKAARAEAVAQPAAAPIPSIGVTVLPRRRVA
jgi:hypothetical protein